MGDLISRQMAIEAVSKACFELRGIFGQCEDALKSLPSAQHFVEVVRCKDCKHRYTDGEHVVFNVCELNHNKVQSDDWYCADAERRTE